jgi:hypothetical protein
MPISPLKLQRRHAELGRIRLGDQRPTQSGKTRPNKLDRFRFTSVSERYIRDLATLYGGEAKSWDNNGLPSWEAYSTAQSIPVIAVKGGLSQWMETWSGGGCVHRCDGITNVLTDSPCNPEDPNHVNAKPTTRLSVMLPELEAIGVWRCETHGWNAAAEIPAVAELAQFVGDLVPANLHLQERRSIVDGKTSRFVVPVLDLQIGTARLKEIVAERSGQQPLELNGGRPALEAAGRGPDQYAEYFRRLEEATGRDDLRDIWQDALAENLVGTKSAPTPERNRFYEAFQAKSQDLVQEQPPEAEGVVDAEVVDDGEAVWQQILAETGKRGWSLQQTADDFARWSGGAPAVEASGGELKPYLTALQAGERDDEQVSA